MAPIILYDLPSRGHCTCWSLNPWKTRLLLNFKKLEYETKWIEYPDIAPTFQKLGITANPQKPLYAIPAVTLPPPNSTSIQDSFAIAHKLESIHPNPTLHLSSPVLTSVITLMSQIVLALTPVLLPRTPRDLLNPPSAEYFQKTRRERFGKPLDELERCAETGGEKAWEAVKGPFGEMKMLLEEREDGPFFLGKEVSYADFVFVAFLRYCKALGADIYERVLAFDPVFAELYAASLQWLEREDH